MGKNVQKKTIHAKKRPKTLKNAIFSFATPKSKSTQQRRRKARATQAEVLVSKAFIALRKEYPHRKSFGRRVVYQRVKGKGVSMKSIQRLLSKKGGRVFPGRDALYLSLRFAMPVTLLELERHRGMKG